MNKPLHKRWWVWVLAFFLAAIVILGLMFFAEVRRIRDQMISGEINLAEFTQQTTRGEINSPNIGSVSINVESSDDPFLGPRDAGVVVVEFGDFQCPFCRLAFPNVRELMTEFGDRVKFIYRDFPIASVHPEAQKAAEAAECAREQGNFWSYHDALYINQDDLSQGALLDYARRIGLDTTSFSTCLASGRYEQEVLEDLRDGAVAGVQGTPTFFVNGQRIEGVIPLNVFRQILLEELELLNN